MAALPESQHTTATAIVKWYEGKPQEHRPHMGASLIGHQCQRYIWLTWRWVLKPQFAGRMLRLFSTGQREEARLIEELRGIGATVWDKDPESGDQFRVSACNGHFGGSLDGVAKGLPEAPKSAAVLEFKTHNDKSFNELCNKKVKGAKPQHFDQMTIYMGLMDIDRAMYMGVNKNNDDVYCEWVHFDQDHFAVLMARAQNLIEQVSSPEPLSHDPTYYICKMCSFHKHCHGGVAAEVNCRTCCHSTPVENAAWSCDHHKKQIDDTTQRAGCEAHLMIPSLIPYAEPIDGGATWIAYKHRELGGTFVNGPEELPEYGPSFSSQELHMCPGSLISDMSKLKAEFPGSKVVSGEFKEDLVAWPFFDDLAVDPATIPVKSDTPVKAAEKRKTKAVVEAMKKFSEGP
jgi:hypothetical protein